MLHLVAESLFMVASLGAAAVIAMMLVTEVDMIRAALLRVPATPQQRAWQARVRLVSRRPALTRRALRSLREAA